MRFIFSFVLCLFISVNALAFEATILAGTPNSKMDFVQNTVKNHVSLIDGENVADLTTAAVFYSAQHGVTSLQTIQILDADGYSFESIFLNGLHLAATTSPIVMSTVGKVSMQSLCARMLDYKNVVFIFAVGSDGKYEDAADEPACLAKHILFVAGLNKEQTNLAGNQSYGAKVRLAVPYTELSAPVDTDRNMTITSKSLGMAMVIGKLNHIKTHHPEFSAEELIQYLLDKKTTHLPILEGKVMGAKALITNR